MHKKCGRNDKTFQVYRKNLSRLASCHWEEVLTETPARPDSKLARGPCNRARRETPLLDRVATFHQVCPVSVTILPSVLQRPLSPVLEQVITTDTGRPRFSVRSCMSSLLILLLVRYHRVCARVSRHRSCCNVCRLEEMLLAVTRSSVFNVTVQTV